MSTEHPAGLPYSAATYQNRACRCDRCRQAAVDAHREWRHRRRTTPPPFIMLEPSLVDLLAEQIKCRTQ